jgi:hypothetical protein
MTVSVQTIAQISVKELFGLNPALAALLPQKYNAIMHRALHIAQLVHEMAALKRWKFGKRSEPLRGCNAAYSKRRSMRISKQS